MKEENSTLLGRTILTIMKDEGFTEEIANNLMFKIVDEVVAFILTNKK